jgi:hypothetical protein
VTNRGNGVFNVHQVVVNQNSYPAIPPVKRMLLEDVNGDQRPDLVLLLGITGELKGTDAVVVFLNTGVYPYFEPANADRFPIAGGGSTFTVGEFAAADVNNDGLNDIIITHAGLGSHGVLLLNHSSQNQPGIPVTLQAGQVVGTADFVNVRKPLLEAEDPTGAYRFVRGLYRAVLNREPDASGLESWVSFLSHGGTRTQAAAGFWNSPEHRGLQVDGFYHQYLNRHADPGGRAHWVSLLQSGALGEAEVERGFLTSEEYRRDHADLTAFLSGLYADVLGRTSDAAGLAAWQAAARAGMSRADLADGFLRSREANRQRIDQFYSQYLGRTGEAQGVLSWEGQLQRGVLSPSQVAHAFLGSEEFFARAGQSV